MDGDDPLVGHVLDGRYRISQRLSSGGAGVVYRCQHTRLDRVFAVKLLTGGFESDEETVKRFEREARITSRFTHPNIVEITDFGVDPVYGIYLVMEYVPGVTVKQLVSWESGLDPDTAIEIALQVCAGMAEAHGTGIIHRDLKSQNLMVIEQDDGPLVKILDFGIAGLADGDNALERLTQTGILMGTPAYMSPEQAAGTRPDHLTDVYAMGCVLFEMLTGKTPFRGPSSLETLKMHLTTEARAPSLRKPDAGITRELDATVAQCLAKRKVERPQSFKMLGAMLEDSRVTLGDPAEQDTGARPTLHGSLTRALEARAQGAVLESAGADPGTDGDDPGTLVEPAAPVAQPSGPVWAASRPPEPAAPVEAAAAAAPHVRIPTRTPRRGPHPLVMVGVVLAMAALGGLAVYLVGSMLFP